MRISPGGDPLPLIRHLNHITCNETGQAALVKMDARTGDVLWRYPLGASVRNSIAIEGGKVLAQDMHRQLYAVDAETGTVSWKKDLEIGVVPPLNDGLVASQGVVYAGTGKMLWASYIGNRPSTVETSPLVAGGIVYVGASDGVIYALDAAKGDTHVETCDRGARVRVDGCFGQLPVCGRLFGKRVWICL